MATNDFDRRIDLTPEPWKGALVDVIDTADAVALGIRESLKMEPTPELLVGLTRLVLEREAQQREARERTEKEAEAE
jgi:hypothetical protein